MITQEQVLIDWINQQIEVCPQCKKFFEKAKQENKIGLDKEGKLFIAKGLMTELTKLKKSIAT